MYACRSWSFCHELKYGIGKVNGVNVLQDLQRETGQQVGERYCSNWNHNHIPGTILAECQEQGENKGVLDCSNNNNNFDVQVCKMFICDELTE